MQERKKRGQSIGDASMKFMRNFTYLGNDLTGARKCNTKIRTFIGLAKKKKIKKGPENRKSDIECWVIFERMKRKMEAEEMWICRRILRIDAASIQ